MQVKGNGYEVIYCTEPLDELCMMEIKKFDQKEITDLGKSDVKGIDDVDETKKEKENKQIEFDVVTKYLADAIGKDKVSKAEVRSMHTDTYTHTRRMTRVKILGNVDENHSHGKKGSEMSSNLLSCVLALTLQERTCLISADSCSV